MWNYIDRHIAYYDNRDIWYLIWESTNDNHLYRGQLVEVVKAQALLITGDGWVCKLRQFQFLSRMCYIGTELSSTSSQLPTCLTHLTLCPDFAHCPSWANTGLKLSHLSFFPFWWFFFPPLTFCIIVPVAVVCLIYLIVFGLPCLFYASLICELSVLN